MSFKVGDKVKIVSGFESYHHHPIGSIGTIDYCNSNSDSYGVSVDGFGQTLRTQHIQLLTKGEKKMSIVSKVKQLALSKGDKLLRKHGVVDPCGDLTEEGQEILLSIVFENYKDAIVEKIQEVDDAEKKGKK